MIALTKFVLKRPVTAVLCVISLVFFGLMALTTMPLELTPEINMPMLVIQTTYTGASPTDIDKLVTKVIEDNLGSLSNVDTITSQSNENYSMIMVQYDYGTDMDNAYSDLRKRLDTTKSALPDDAGEPTIFEIDMNSAAAMYVAVYNPSIDNIYNYVEEEVVPEIEKLSSVGNVEVMGGGKEYIQVLLDPEKLSQYNLTAANIASAIGAADFTIPAGTANYGSIEMSVSTEVSYDTPESLEDIPITLGNGNIIYIKDVATVNRTQENVNSTARYNGEDVTALSITRNNQYTAVDVSDDVLATLDELERYTDNLSFLVIYDSADMVRAAIKSMLKTLAWVIVLSGIILFIFYGDVKASLIVATSIPISILMALCLMWVQDYTMNMITLGALVLAVGMMVDNSIVTLESCFRLKEENPGVSFQDYIRTAVAGTDQVISSIFGGTITTCVVFIPIAFISGLSGQFFAPLGFTIVFCMLASFVSACSIVPLCYVYYKPEEKEKAPAYRAIRAMQEGYRNILGSIMRHKKLTLAATAAGIALSVFAATDLGMSLLPMTDEGTVSITVDMRDNLSQEKQNEILKQVEAVIAEEPDVDNYMIDSGGATVYLKDDRQYDTEYYTESFKEKLQSISGGDISVDQSSMMSAMLESSGFSVTLVSADYDSLKEASDNIYESLQQDPRVTSAQSTLANTTPVIKVKVDPVSAAAEGFAPAQIGSTLYSMLSGSSAESMNVDGNDLSIKIEFPEGEYDDLNKVEDILLTSPMGNTVYLKDIAEITFEDSPYSIPRSDKQYMAQVSASYTAFADVNTRQALMDEYVTPNLGSNVSTQVSMQTEMMNEEFTSLGMAIAVAIFLVFVVMAAQFESPRFSGMVMATIPFAMIGALGFLWIFDIDISMISLLGFLMLIGTVVNNGILYVNTVDDNRQRMGLEDALVEAGVIRLKPILMTTLTTIVGMIPMAAAVGTNGELMQGLAMVEVGGLITSTILALLVLPVLYYYVNGNRDRRRVQID